MSRFLLYILMGCTPPAEAHININLQPEYDDTYAAELDPYAPKGLKSAYLSSVVVQAWEDGVPQGSGSGNYFKLGRDRFIITAAHVVDGSEEIMILEKGFRLTPAKVIYSDSESDIAVLVPMEKLRHTKAVPFRRDINNQMGEKVYHCGHPAREAWHISEGLLTGTHTDTLLVNTFAWPGSSGSVIFDQSGRVIGVLSAIRIGTPFGFPDMIEHIVLAGNIKMLDKNTLKAALENGK